MKSKPKSQFGSISPVSNRIEIELNNLKTLEISLVSPLRIQKALVHLSELYVPVEEVIRTPLTQKTVLWYGNGSLVEDALEESIGLLDTCSNLRDLLALTKENVCNLQFALRRRGGDSSVERHILSYFRVRMKLKRNIGKSLGSLKQMESKLGSSLWFDVDQHLSMVIRVLRGVVAFTISVFRALFFFLSSETKSATGILAISKFLLRSRSNCNGDRESISLMEMVDVALNSLCKNIRNKETKNLDVQMAMARLQNLDAIIECFEAGLDCLFRKLIRVRVSLLNILAN